MELAERDLSKRLLEKMELDSEFLSWNKRRKILESSKQVILEKIRELEESETRVIEQPEEERQLMAKRSEQLMEVARKYEHRRQVEEFQME